MIISPKRVPVMIDLFVDTVKQVKDIPWQEWNYVFCKETKTTWQVVNWVWVDLKKIVMPNGPKGEDLTFDKLTDAQKNKLRGNPFKFEDFSEDQLDKLVDKIVWKVLEKIPKPKNGKDGKDADEKKIIEIILEKIPTPKNGENGKDADELKIIKSVVWYLINDEKFIKEVTPKPGKDGKSYSELSEKEKNEILAKIYPDIKKMIPDPIPGKDWKSLRYEDLTTEQKKELQGKQWEKLKLNDLSEKEKKDLVKEIWDYVLSRWNK
jgi:hypothetical protein